MLVLALVAAGCGEDEPAETTAAATTQAQATTAATEAAPMTAGEVMAMCDVAIPEVSVNFGMAPFGDHTIYSHAMAEGWFEEVGININEKFATIPYEQIVALLVNEDYDFTTQYGPNQLQSMLRAPDVQQITFSDAYVGLYFLAPPDSGLDTVPDLVASGMSYEDAFEQVVGQMVGKRVAIDDTGSHRSFVDAVFEAVGVTPDDFAELITVDDARMLLLGRGGQADFVKPLGGAQNAELMQDGWYPILGATDLIALLPPGDPRGATGIGHTGLGARASHYAEDPDTFLRVVSVMFRVIDAVKRDVAEGTDDALANILPVLESAAAVEIGIDGLRIIYGQIDPMKSFEEQTEYWDDESNPFHYKNVYRPQIEAAQEGGILPADEELDPSLGFGLAEEIYDALVELRDQYDSMVSQAGSLEGPYAEMAAIAATHYENRNYLDAARILETAVGGGC
ncbi:MAG: hypothetical protein F4X74_07095 [Acidimicrobiia bacterium]|nr:hypothetical protein [Acidimicrobiia bacterium]